MHFSRSVLVATVLVSPTCLLAAQAQANATPASGGSASNFTAAAPSSILQRPLDELQQTMGAIKLDKWKRGSIRDEAGTNLDAIQRDLGGTLPALLKEADAAPGSLTKVLPVSRNVAALYDVLLHVVEGGRVIGPGDQVGMLQQTMKDLEQARVALDNQIQQAAEAQEKQVVELRSTVQKQDVSLRAAMTPPPAAKCPAPAAAAKKKKRTTTPATKPASGTPANQPPKTQ
jgi:hypothetical protein